MSPSNPNETATRKRRCQEKFTALRDADGRVLESLWSIGDPSRAYMRVVEAELALEALK